MNDFSQDPEIVALKAAEQRKRVRLAIIGVAIATVLLVVAVIAKLSSDASDREKTEQERRFKEAQKEASRERERTRDPLGAVAASGDWMADMSIADVKAATGLDDVGGLRLESKTPKVRRIWNGSGSWRGRSLPAVLIEEEFSLVAREEGIRKQICLVQAALKDGEFSMWREHAAMRCDSAGDADVRDWKERHGFVQDPSP